MKGANRLFWERNAMVIVGMLLFSMGINFFIVPAQLYNGGVLGISQIIRTILTTYLSLSFGERLPNLGLVTSSSLFCPQILLLPFSCTLGAHHLS